MRRDKAGIGPKRQTGEATIYPGKTLAAAAPAPSGKGARGAARILTLFNREVCENGKFISCKVQEVVLCLTNT